MRALLFADSLCHRATQGVQAHALAPLDTPRSPPPPRAAVIDRQLFFAQEEEEEDDLYDAQELAIRGSGGAVGGRGGGPTELLLELDDWVQFRVRGIVADMVSS